MKVVERYEIEYVVPETDEERREIQEIIDDFEKNRRRKIDLTQLVRADQSPQLKNGYWRK